MEYQLDTTVVQFLEELHKASRPGAETRIRFYHRGCRYGAELTKTGVKDELTDETYDTLWEWIESITGSRRKVQWSKYVYETEICEPDDKEWKLLAEVLESSDWKDSEFLD